MGAELACCHDPGSPNTPTATGCRGAWLTPLLRQGCNHGFPQSVRCRGASLWLAGLFSLELNTLCTPALHPWPQVAAELGNLEESREAMENANMARLQQEANKATLDARRRIGDTIGKAMRVFDDPKVASTILTKWLYNACYQSTAILVSSALAV